MSHNNLTDKAMGQFAEAIAVNTGIVELIYTHNNLSLGPNGAQFVGAIGELKGLKKLSLNSCQLDLELLEVLRDSIKDNETLTDLNLYSNDINSEGAQLIANMLLNKVNLKNLGLSNNFIGFGGAREIAQAIIDSMC